MENLKEYLKLTPYPWSTETENGVSWIVDADGDDIDLSGLIPEYSEKVAKIQAAAPELLEALNAAYQKFSNIENQWAGRGTPEGQYLLVQMRDAIAKATA